MTSDINSLLDKYYDGETSAEEEKVLRHYFMQDELPEEIKIYASLFRFIEDESTALEVLQEIKTESNNPIRRKHFFVTRLRSIAAVAAILTVAMLLLYQPISRSTSSKDSYAWVDGTLITDPSMVTKYAETSFGNVEVETDIIEEQLRSILE